MGAFEAKLLGANEIIDSSFFDLWVLFLSLDFSLCLLKANL